MTEKTTKQWIAEMKAAFGDGIHSIQVRLPDGTVFKQTDNWIDEDVFLKMEKQRKASESKNKRKPDVRDSK